MGAREQVGRFVKYDKTIEDASGSEEREKHKLFRSRLTGSKTFRGRTIVDALCNGRNIPKRLLSVAPFALFIGYYSLCSFKVPWLGDFNRHVAAVHALYEDFRHPMHEAIPVDGKYTDIYS